MTKGQKGDHRALFWSWVSQEECVKQTVLQNTWYRHKAKVQQSFEVISVSWSHLWEWLHLQETQWLKEKPNQNKTVKIFQTCPASAGSSKHQNSINTSAFPAWCCTFTFYFKKEQISHPTSARWSTAGAACECQRIIERSGLEGTLKITQLQPPAMDATP